MSDPRDRTVRPHWGGRIVDEPGSGPRIDVPLAYPLRVGRAVLTAVDLVPPALEDLEGLADAAEIAAADVIVAASGLPARVVRRLRWPDVATLLEAAREILPAGFFERFESPVAPSAAPPEPAATIAEASPLVLDPVSGDVSSAPPTDPDDETLPPGEAVDLVDFVTSTRL
jgi:hypothetical protein